MVERIDTVLIANRGEIAVRVARTLRTMGITSVAVYSDADAGARHVTEADTAVRIGPAAAKDSYLSIRNVIEAAERTGAQAIHPGYGFLSENAEFAAACAQADIAFLGPSATAIAAMGDKITAKDAVTQFGVPVVPGISRPGLTDADLISGADEVGFPVLVKPSAGGGGKGMRLVERAEDLPAALASARREAASSFGDDTLFLERFVLRPRHIEVQILADQHGNVIHLGERECSLQRRHQKVIEEAPSPLLDAQTRARIGEAACNTARSVDYTGAGTVEFIVSANSPDEFFFMEMNTRLQVEHPVTEMVTGLDLVEWQVRIAAGEVLSLQQNDIVLTGHAIETRVYAEDPGRGFLPTGGTVVGLREPGGDGVRIDSSLSVGTEVGSNYDPMLSKVIAYGPDRPTALRTLDRALSETAVLGVVTNIEFARFLLDDDDVRAGTLDTGLLDRRLEDFTPESVPDQALIAAAAVSWLEMWTGAGADIWSSPTGWRVGEHAPFTVRLSTGEAAVHVSITGVPGSATVAVGDGPSRPLHAELRTDTIVTVVDGHRETARFAHAENATWISSSRGTWSMSTVSEPSVRAEEAHSGNAEIVSPMPGSVIAVEVATGDAVSAGSAVVVVEAMKMEHALTTPVDGTVELAVSVGDQVQVDQVLARIIPNEDSEVQS
ncbi:acetyl/propionyl-CoA carboxylase subunit alpha [Rhodococcus sp. 06-156-3C]|uniref:acetyl/propionyl/methylcrotonyl-CoA carboxylase subunit alpha n=1 Tax=Nocardiaceae TaxID=85025 RepID=UPI0005230426|nr:MULTISPECIES: acetyl-CoA carboxylase biotin carboxylase subunit [Rhodococcus]OZD12520.1 acetyl/propionyl-CoA carboxylase subunit alpha [Rhodococcus sp. 06-156-4a]OZD18071.1 acetyl/propionyl-CoA carboxylase subunit alpha [Rhodococcus sp. 06-156-3C]OZD20366.1 acetyl/propionyl-CoA carboxylase subunit alpha [Rhodococcus sp. 06-156-4C]OZD29213.1 acetyl/propionyl-CoA carboxylase subunit alpha [Rhodococcus sp. 06-156-3]OZD30484.1 acetyl/propionyl-CoA carboxylase subunit alpha [Rhodococcus sp. 06-1